MSVVFAVVAGLVVGVVIGRLVSSRSATGAAFATLGATAGLMIGMSVSPVVATAVTTLLGLLTVLVPVYFQDQANRQAAAAAPPAPGQPSPAPPPLPPIGEWLFPFGAMLLVGVLGGTAVRVNNALDFSPPAAPPAPKALSVQYQEMGFDAEQVKLIMAGHARELASKVPPPKDQEASSPKRESSILHNADRPASWPALWKAAVKPDKSPEENLDELRRILPGPIRERIDRLKQEGKEADVILAMLVVQFGSTK